MSINAALHNGVLICTTSKFTYFGKQRKVSRVKQTQPFILGIVGVTL